MMMPPVVHRACRTTRQLPLRAVYSIRSVMRAKRCASASVKIQRDVYARYMLTLLFTPDAIVYAQPARRCRHARWLLWHATIARI